MKQFRSYSDFWRPHGKKITGLEPKCMSIHANKNALAVTINDGGDNIVVTDNDVGDHVIEENINPSWIRLSEFLIQHKELVEDKNVAVVGRSWISSVVNQLQLDSAQVVQYEHPDNIEIDDLNNDDNGTECQVLSPTYINSLDLSPKVCDILLSSSLSVIDLQVETKVVDDLWENGDDGVVILATSSSILAEDPFVNDYLRQTSSIILMDRDMVDIFCYHPRIQEGADIILW